LCTKTYARYTQAPVHHAYSAERISQEKVVARTEDAEKGTIDNPIEILNPFDNLATEENEEADLIQEPIKVTIPTFQCEECDKTFSKKTGPSQHERFRHPNIRNAKRIAEKENDIERKRLAREN
jgi:hypothetical protein